MPASTAQQLTTAQRRAQCLEMRLAGARWDRIAERLGYSGKAAACKDYTRALEAAADTVKRNADHARQIERLRLDRLQSAFWPRAMSGDHRAGRICLDVHDRRVKLDDLLGAQRARDNAVDAWLSFLGGDTAGLSDDDAAALAAASA